MSTHINIAWSDDFNVGNEKIDKEHKELFIIAQKCSQIENISDISEQQKILKLVLKKLYEYVVIHFSHEEKLMQEINYLDIEQHKTIHKEILKSLNQLVTKLNNYSINEISKKINDFIKLYFIVHIKEEDMKIVSFQNKQ